MKYKLFIILKKILVAIIILFSTSSLNAQIDTVITRTHDLFASGNYSQGFLTLNNCLYNNTLDSISQAKVQYELASYYEQYVGDFDISLQFYQKVADSNLPKNDVLLTDAKERIVQINNLFIKYENTNKDLLEFKSLSHRQNTEEELKTLVSGLMQLLISTPDFYKKAEIFYLLGFNYKELGKFGKAKRYFQMALKEKPAIDFMIPVSLILKDSISSYTSILIKKMSSIILGIFILASIILFYMAKPWIWIKWKQMIPIGLLFTLWTLFYFILFYIVGNGYASHFVDKESFHGITTFFLFTFPGSPTGEFSLILYMYGLFAIFGLYIFALGINDFIRNKWAKTIVLPIVGFLLFLSLTGVFYINNIHEKRTILIGEEPAWQRSYLYSFLEMEPIVLSDPKSYPNLDLDEIYSEVFVDWLIKHCEFDQEINKEDIINH